MMIRSTSGLLMVSLVGTACGSDDATSSPTYREHIAPLYAKHCVSCHREGDIAPFALDSFDAPVETAHLARSAVESRTMPPFAVDNSGECRTHRHARWLDRDEIALVGAWIDGGMLEGDAAEGATIPPSISVGLDGEVVNVTMPRPYTPPADGSDIYRCFAGEMSLDRDVFVTGYQLHPGNKAIVHHVVVWSFDPDARGFAGPTNAESIAAIDGADGQPGWDCLGIGGGVQTNGMPAIWTPGTPPTRFPDGTGLPLEQGHRLLFEIHYYVAQGSGSDMTSVDLQIADQVERPAEMVLVDGLIDRAFSGDAVEFEAGREAIPYTWEGDIATMSSPPGPGSDKPTPDQIDIYGIFPHMHEVGSAMHATRRGPDGDACMADLPRWDFNWQQVYFYDEPIRMTATDVAEVTCIYDTRRRTESTRPGFMTEDEMCTFGLFLTRP